MCLGALDGNGPGTGTPGVLEGIVWEVPFFFFFFWTRRHYERESWRLPAQWKSMVGVIMLKDVKADNRHNFVTNAQCIVSYFRLSSFRRRPTSHITATAPWTAAGSMSTCRVIREV